MNWKNLISLMPALALAGYGTCQAQAHPQMLASTQRIGYSVRAEAATTAPEVVANAEVLAYAEEMPTFPGGDVALHAFLAKKINYPAEARRLNLTGTVVVRFVVEELGRVIDAEVVRGSGHGFDEEALRLVRIMPWWTPGKIAGRPVRVRRAMPIIFRLSH